MVDKMHAVSAATTSGTSSTKSNRKLPDDKTLKPLADSLNMTVKELREKILTATVPNGKGICHLAKTLNQMDMKTFCLLNGIDPSKWQEYKVKSGEQFFVINNPNQYKKTGSTNGTTNVAPKEKPAPAPATPVQVPTAPTSDTTTQQASVAGTTNQNSEVSDQQKEIKTPTDIAYEIYRIADENSKAVGLPEFDAILSKITPKNVEEIILEYTNNPNNKKKEGILETIGGEWNKSDIIDKAMLKIYDALAHAQKTDPEYRDKFINEKDNSKRQDMLLRMIGTPEIIAAQLEKEVDHNKGAVGTDSFNDVLNLINKNNIADVMAEYEKLGTGESIIEAIIDETSSSETDRQNAVMHVFNAYAEHLGTPAKVREAFETELAKETQSKIYMSSNTLDKYIEYMTADPKTIATQMEKLIDNNFIAGAVNEREFQVLLNLITKDNIIDVITEYDNIEDSDESLIKGILRETHDNKADRKAAVMHIYDTLAQKFNVPKETKIEFEAELNHQLYEKWGLVDTTKLDDIINSIVGGATTAGAFRSDLSRFEHTTEEGRVKLTLGNGKVWTAGDLKQSAIDSAKDDPGFTKVNNPFIPRPLPYVNSSGNIEPTCEILRPTPAKGVEQTLQGKLVILNPGHGGYNPHSGFFDAGTVLSVKNAEGKEMPIEEWRVADLYTRDLAAKLQAKGATVLIISGPVTGKGAMADEDVDYLAYLMKGERNTQEVRDLITSTDRSNISFMSIHVESVKENPDKKACTVRPTRDDASDKKLANNISQNISQNLIHLTPTIEENNYYVTRTMGKDIPAVLVEIGNIANEDVAKSLLSSGDRDKYTTALALALETSLLER